MNMNDSTYRIIADRELLEYLSPKEDRRYSKMDAFMDLLDRTAHGAQRTYQHDGHNETLLNHQLAVAVTKLAEAWGWHRGTVKNFLLTLEKLGVIQLRSEAKLSIITFNRFSIGEEPSYSQPLTEDELRINRWLCGYIAVDEMVKEWVQSDTEIESLLTEKTADDTDRTGSRLHKIVAHLILQNSNLIPEDPEVKTALSCLFHKYCNQNLTCLLQLFALSGLRLMPDTGSQCIVNLLGIEPPEARRYFEKIAGYYFPFLDNNSVQSISSPRQTVPSDT